MNAVQGISKILFRTPETLDIINSSLVALIHAPTNCYSVIPTKFVTFFDTHVKVIGNIERDAVGLYFNEWKKEAGGVNVTPL